jgi:c-di-GMP-binding flagellar brake protein YcgR
MSNPLDGSIAKAATQEKRKLKRFNSPFSINYFNAETAQETVGVLRDISYGGAKVQLPVHLSVSATQIISLGIVFPDVTLKVSGTIAWVNDLFDKKEVGVKFTQLTDTGKETIYNNIFKYFREEITGKWWQS